MYDDKFPSSVTCAHIHRIKLLGVGYIALKPKGLWDFNFVFCSLERKRMGNVVFLGSNVLLELVHVNAQIIFFSNDTIYLPI